MAKQKSETEELLFSLGIDLEADDLLQTYVGEIANKRLRDVSGNNPIWC